MFVISCFKDPELFWQPDSPTARSSASGPPSTTTGGDKPRAERDLFKASREGREAELSRETVVLAGRRSPNPPSSATCKLTNDEATSEMTAERKTLEHLHVNTLQSSGETFNHVQSMPAQHRSTGREDREQNRKRGVTVLRPPSIHPKERSNRSLQEARHAASQWMPLRAPYWASVQNR